MTKGVLMREDICFHAHFWLYLMRHSVRLTMSGSLFCVSQLFPLQHRRVGR